LTPRRAVLCSSEHIVIPYRIETLFQHEPWANKLLFGATIAAGLAREFGLIPDEVYTQFFIWGEGGPLSLIGYQFAHAGIAHLAGNMVFLWVFGNAVCATVGNWAYLTLYLGLGAFAGLVHMLIGGAPVVGASGAISGVVGLAVAFYPINKVNLFYMLGLIPRTGRLWLWTLALYWTFWDIVGAVFHLGPVAYWAHIGGTAAGVATGLGLLACGRVQLTEFDHGSTLDFILRRTPPHKQRASDDIARAEIRRAAQAYLSAYAAEPGAGLEPAIPAQRRRLQLRRRTEEPDVPTPTATSQDSTATTAETPASIRFGKLTAPKPAAIPAATNPSAWPAELPDVRYFYFDGIVRHGPASRAEFLQALSLAPTTERWWYWAENMTEWRRVSALGDALPLTHQGRASTVLQHRG